MTAPREHRQEHAARGADGEVGDNDRRFCRWAVQEVVHNRRDGKDHAAQGRNEQETSSDHVCQRHAAPQQYRRDAAWCC
jgi:hypothetical protein